jgi:hypothetical protein
VLKTCEVCPTEFQAKRASAKYCSERCKKRAQRRPGGVKAAKVLPLPAEPTSEPADGQVIKPSVDGPLTAATTAELQDAGRFETAVGQAALALARRIDHGLAETGSALAAMVREHRATLTEAVRDAKKAADPLDELRARRERKRDTG